MGDISVVTRFVNFVASKTLRTNTTVTVIIWPCSVVINTPDFYSGFFWFEYLQGEMQSQLRFHGVCLVHTSNMLGRPTNHDCFPKINFSEMWCCVVARVDPDVSKDRSFFETSGNIERSSAISQKTRTIRNNAARPSNMTRLLSFPSYHSHAPYHSTLHKFR